MPSHKKALHKIVKHHTIKIEDYRNIIEYYIEHPVNEPYELLSRIDLVSDAISFVRTSLPIFYKVSRLDCFTQSVQSTQELFFHTISTFLKTL